VAFLEALESIAVVRLSPYNIFDRVDPFYKSAVCPAVTWMHFYSSSVYGLISFLEAPFSIEMLEPVVDLFMEAAPVY